MFRPLEERLFLLSLLGDAESHETIDSVTICDLNVNNS